MKNQKYKSILALIIFLLSSPLYGEELSEVCKQRVLFEYIECVSQQTKLADKRLNSHYKILRDQLNKEDKIKLRNTQRTWIKFRDEDCGLKRDLSEVPNPSNGLQGLQGALAYSECIYFMTEKRSQELSRLHPNY